MIEIFNNDELGKRYQVLEEVEGILLNHPESFDTEELIHLFYFYTKHRKGSSILIRHLASRIPADLDKLKISPESKL